MANLAPAVLEAHHSAVGLLVVSADRPASMRRTGANQTTSQTAMFGAAAAFEEVSSAEGGRTPCARWRATVCRALRPAAVGGPVQLNVNLGEPLLGIGIGAGTDIGSASDPALDGRDDGRPWTTVGLAERVTGVEPPAFAEPSRTVVVVGDAGRATGAAAGALARRHGWPVFAEPSSNARVAPSAIRLYRLLLGAAHGPAAELTAAIERVVVVGHPTLSRPVSRLLGRTDLDVVVCGPAPWTDVAGTARLVLPEVPAVSEPALATAGAIDADWLRSWIDLDRRLAAALPEPGTPTGGAVAAAVALAATDQIPLMVGSSSPVRDLDLAPVPQVGAPVFANRGLGGIDGVVSTAVGVALSEGRALALMGDLTFLHDANGLLIGPLERRPNLRIVVVNDDGGSIFHTLEPGSAEFRAGFERLFGTPHGADISARCRAVGVRHRLVSDLVELAAILAEPIDGCEVVEVPVPRHGRRAEADELARLASFEG